MVWEKSALGFSNSRTKMGFEKSQILGQAWSGLGPGWAGLGAAQKRQKRQPYHFCHVTASPDLTPLSESATSAWPEWLEICGSKGFHAAASLKQ